MLMLILLVFTLLISFVLLLFFVWIHTVPLQQGPKEAMVILGYKSDGDTIHPLLQDRLDAALQLLQSSPDCKIIVSGGNVGTSFKSEAEIMRNYLIQHGVLPERIIIENQSRDTIDNLVNCRHILEREGIQDYVLISSSFHIRRAQYIAGSLGMHPAFYANRNWNTIMRQRKLTFKEIRIFYFTYKALTERQLI